MVAEALEEWDYTGDDADIYELKEVTMIYPDLTCLCNDASSSSGRVSFSFTRQLRVMTIKAYT